MINADPNADTARIIVEKHEEPLIDGCASCGDPHSHVSIEFGAARSTETLCQLCAMTLVRRIVKSFTPERSHNG